MHRCIVYGKVTHRQVLANKLVFQAGPWPVSLGQSACGQHAYEKSFYGIPKILCSNDFVLEGKPLTVEEQGWLQANVMEATLGPGVAWFHASQPGPALPLQPPFKQARC